MPRICNYNDTGCQSKAAPGRMMCEKHLRQQMERMRARAARHRAAGLCLTCDEQVATGSCFCKKHILLHREYFKAHYKPKSHKCPMCKMVLVMGKARYCAVCQPKAKEIRRKKNAISSSTGQRHRREKGLCIRCGTKAAKMDGKFLSRCPKHRKEINQQQLDRFHANPHLCKCGEKLVFHGRLCDKCRSNVSNGKIAARIAATKAKLARLEKEMMYD